MPHPAPPPRRPRKSAYGRTSTVGGKRTSSASGKRTGIATAALDAVGCSYRRGRTPAVATLLAARDRAEHGAEERASGAGQPGRAAVGLKISRPWYSV